MVRHPAHYSGETLAAKKTPERTPSQAKLEASLAALTTIVHSETMATFAGSHERAVSKGLMRKLTRDGIQGNGYLIGHLSGKGIKPAFTIQSGENIFSFQHGNNRVSSNNGTSYDTEELLASDLSNGMTTKIAEALNAARQLIEEQSSQKKALLESFLQRMPQEIEPTAVTILNLDEALSGLITLMGSGKYRDIYLYGTETDDRELRFNNSGYDCRPANALTEIQTALTALDHQGIKTGKLLTIPLLKALDSLERDMKDKEPITLTGHFIRKQLREFLSQFGISLPGDNNLSIQRFTEIKTLLEEVKDHIAASGISNLNHFTTDPYLNALLEVSEPPWKHTES